MEFKIQLLEIIALSSHLAQILLFANPWLLYWTLQRKRKTVFQTYFTDLIKELLFLEEILETITQVDPLLQLQIQLRRNLMPVYKSQQLRIIKGFLPSYHAFQEPLGLCHGTQLTGALQCLHLLYAHQASQYHSTLHQHIGVVMFQALGIYNVFPHHLLLSATVAKARPLIPQPWANIQGMGTSLIPRTHQKSLLKRTVQKDVFGFQKLWGLMIPMKLQRALYGLHLGSRMRRLVLSTVEVSLRHSKQRAMTKVKWSRHLLCCKPTLQPCPGH